MNKFFILDLGAKRLSCESSKKDLHICKKEILMVLFSLFVYTQTISYLENRCPSRFYLKRMEQEKINEFKKVERNTIGLVYFEIDMIL